LESAIREAFARKHHLVAVFFDLEKAYDTTWRYGILRSLHLFGFRGRLPLFLSDFLKDRSFRVRVGSTLSDRYIQESGVPQGSVLSVSLFAVAINGIAHSVSIPHSIYVDDFALWVRSPQLRSCERQLQLAINSACSWVGENGFRFSASKTVCVHFSRQRGINVDPQLRLGQELIQVAPEARFLGLLFDSKLTWAPHLRQLKDKCFRAMNILRALSGSSWGADRAVMLRLYRALIRSKLDYACFVYGSASGTSLKMLDSVHNEGIRLATGAFRTSPVVSLAVESAEPPLSQRRQQLMLHYATKLAGLPDNPAYQAVYGRNEVNGSRERQHFGDLADRLRECCAGIAFEMPRIARYGVMSIPPWQVPLLPCNYDMAALRRSSTPLPVYQHRFHDAIGRMPDYVPIYTDGSKSADAVGYSFVFGQSTFSGRLPAEFSVFMAELYAIGQAIRQVRLDSRSKFVIFTDSLSAMQAVSAFDPRNPMVQAIQERLPLVTGAGKEVVLCWVPGHVGIAGNERADRAAKEALGAAVVRDLPVLDTDLRPLFRGRLQAAWQDSWVRLQDNKLRSVKGGVGEWCTSFRSNRREEVVIARLRIGHTYLTHNHLLQGLPRPACAACGEPVSVRHILLDCAGYRLARGICGIAAALDEVLGDNFQGLQKVLRFFKAVGLYTQI
jgi:ribonuclease HI